LFSGYRKKYQEQPFSKMPCLKNHEGTKSIERKNFTAIWPTAPRSVAQMDLQRRACRRFPV
jgi:hypothetical protein